MALQTGEESEHMVTIGNTGGFDLEYGVDIVLNDEMGRTTTINVVTRKDAVSNMACVLQLRGAQVVLLKLVLKYNQFQIITM